MKTAAGAVYRKSDIAQTKIDTSELKKKKPKKGNARRSPHGDEPKTKSKKKESGKQEANRDSDEMPEIQERSEMANAAALYQDSHLSVTPKDTEVNGGLNLSVKRAKPNNAGPVLENSKSSVSKGA